MKIVILDAGTMRVEDSAWEGLRTFGKVDLYSKTSNDINEILERVGDAEIVICNKVLITKEVCAELDQVKLITLLATGVNNVDLDAASAAGITVCNVPAYSSASVAQHTIAMILALTNKVGDYNQSVQAGDWITSEYFCYWNHEMPDLEGRTLGIVGFGDIGRRVGKIANAMGMKVLASMRTPRDAPNWEGFEFVDNELLFRRSDVISLHCPLTQENQKFVNRELLSTCKPNAILINTARGGLIHEAEFATSLKEGLIGGAVLDVVDGEPMRKDSPLLGVPNLLITPHLAWASVESRMRLLKETELNISRFSKGEVHNKVN